MDNLVEIGKKNSAYKAIDDFIDKVLFNFCCCKLEKKQRKEIF